MKNVQKKMVVMLWLLIVACPAMATDTTVFYDQITGYKDSMLYYTACTDVELSQDNGDNPTILSTLGSWDVTEPDQFCRLTSGTSMKYTTIAVDNYDSTARYGQIMVTMGVDTSSTVLLRLALFGIDTPQFPDEWGNSATNAGPEIRWGNSAALWYGSDGAMCDGSQVFPSAFHSVTINYDLINDTYDAWCDTTQFLDDVNFGTALASANSIAIGGAYSNGGIAVLDYWHWKTSTDTAFTSYGAEVTDPYVEDPYVNVKSFGAEGDGTTDDTNAIEDALTYINVANDYGNNILYFPPGTYLVTSPLVIPANCKVMGSGTWDTTGQPYPTIILGKHTGTAVVSLVGKNFCLLENLMIKGDSTTTPKTGLLLGRSSAASAGNQ